MTLFHNLDETKALVYNEVQLVIVYKVQMEIQG